MWIYAIYSNTNESKISSWLAEQEDRGSIPGLATWIFRYWLSAASKIWLRYHWSDVNPQYNQPIKAKWKLVEISRFQSFTLFISYRSNSCVSHYQDTWWIWFLFRKYMPIRKWKVGCTRVVNVLHMGYPLKHPAAQWTGAAHYFYLL